MLFRSGNGVEWEEDQYPKTKFVPQQEKYDPTSFKGTQAQDDLPPQDHKNKGKDKCNQLPHLALVHGVTNPLVGKTRDKVT